MARSIKKIAHDLLPLSGAISELSSIVAQLLGAIRPAVEFNDPKVDGFFEESMEALDKLTLSANLIKKYILEVDEEADRDGIKKE